LREFKELGDSEQALLPIEEESLGAVETSETRSFEESSVTNDLAEDEVAVAFEVETNGALLEEPVEQA
jgi:hypothetical protein